MQSSGQEPGDYLRKKREERGVSLRQMARRVGRDNSNLSKIERGELEACVTVLAAYARVLRLNRSETDYLFSLAGCLPPDVAPLALWKNGAYVRLREEEEQD